MNRSRAHLMTAMLFGMMLPLADERPKNFDMPDGRLPPPADPLSPRERLEMDLIHAEEQVALARTPGGRRKARRKVDAIAARLRSTRGEEHDG